MERRSGPNVVEILKGLAIGIIIPVAAFYLVKFIFGLLVSQGLMDGTTSGISDRRLRTISLIAICFNIIPLQIVSKRRGTSLIRGIVLATLILGGIWIYQFKDGLF